jgi:ankyrin repeat protein
MSPPALERGDIYPTSFAWSRIRDLESIADLAARERYLPTGGDLAAIVQAAPTRPARLSEDVRAVSPVLKALNQMDLREGSEAVAEWIDRYSSAVAPRMSDYTLVQMIGWLQVLPEGQIDLTALRDRVLARASPQARPEYTRAFDRVETMNRDLQQPTEATLVTLVRANNIRLVKYVLGRGISANARDSSGETALTASRQSFEMQRFLVEAGADPNLPNGGGMTPFHLAVAWFEPKAAEPYRAVDYFYTKKADVNRVAYQGTPLMSASARSPEMVRYLLERGARTDLTNREGLTPLHVAARAPNPQIVAMLLAAGANPNARDRDAARPLHFAVQQRNVEIARLLIDRGADVNAEFQGGMTPLLMARDNKDKAMESLLEQHGGRVNLAFVAKRAALRKLFEDAPGGH